MKPIAPSDADVLPDSLPFAGYVRRAASRGACAVTLTAEDVAVLAELVVEAQTALQGAALASIGPRVCTSQDRRPAGRHHMSDEGHTLHLIRLDPDKRANAARGLRDALKLGGMEPEQVPAAIEALLEAARGGHMPLGLIESPDLDKLESCLAVLHESSRGAAEGAIDLEPQEHELLAAAAKAAADMREPSGPPDDGTDYVSKITDEEVSFEASQTALVQLGLAKGNVAVAYAQSRMLGRVTGDPEFWSEVCRVIVTAFNIELDPE